MTYQLRHFSVLFWFNAQEGLFAVLENARRCQLGYLASNAAAA